MKEVTITLMCDYPNAGHDFVKGEGIEEFVDETAKAAKRQAFEKGWIYDIIRSHGQRDACYCPECVNGARSYAKEMKE